MTAVILGTSIISRIPAVTRNSTHLKLAVRLSRVTAVILGTSIIAVHELWKWGGIPYQPHSYTTTFSVPLDVSKDAKH